MCFLPHPSYPFLSSFPSPSCHPSSFFAPFSPCSLIVLPLFLLQLLFAHSIHFFLLSHFSYPVHVSCFIYLTFAFSHFSWSVCFFMWHYSLLTSLSICPFRLIFFISPFFSLLFLQSLVHTLPPFTLYCSVLFTSSFFYLSLFTFFHYFTDYPLPWFSTYASSHFSCRTYILSPTKTHSPFSRSHTSFFIIVPSLCPPLSLTRYTFCSFTLHPVYSCTSSLEHYHFINSHVSKQLKHTPNN